jgi:putative aldouronate transport system substrate-binding protein
VSKTYATKGAQLDQIVADARIKFLAGQIDEEGLRAELQRWHREGGDQIIEEMTELYAKIK